MAVLLLNLRDVPADEAEEVRALLDAEGIEWYETKPSLWGISGGGLWAADDEQAGHARERLARYQEERTRRMRAERERDEAEGRAPSAWAAFRERPLQSFATVLGIVMMLAVATLPFLLFGR
ncbi:MAG: hypothetical protein ABS41_00860 [Arenimonas sp. SCN 70-307]|uniref:DUF6164 family protein n=1 Tax=Arenimonas sp. SCN 70-307 TaxID=1660089 RepID=UPI00086F280F|nr:DUF6164 family protein [Arenimonas sp. SCN 70-307]ODS64985.1 MAG: hypothetical protein ABS41_00860 [Arenimonas sp. SCN 70-307]